MSSGSAGFDLDRDAVRFAAGQVVKVEISKLHVIDIYSKGSGQSTQVTDGLSDAHNP